MDTKKEYIAPNLTVVSFKMEQGYAVSDVRLFQDFILFNEDYDDKYNTQSQEIWESGGNYFGETWYD